MKPHLHSRINSTKSCLQKMNRPSIRVRFERVLMYVASLTVFFSLLLCFGMQLMLVYTLLISGIVVKLWIAFISHHITITEEWASLALGCFILLAAIGDFVLLRDKESFLMPHAFFHLYARCQYIEPERLSQFRISQVMLRHPENFDYGFYRGKLTIFVGKGRVPSNTANDEQGNVVESFLVSSQTQQQDESETSDNTETSENLPSLLEEKKSSKISIESTEQLQLIGDVVPSETTEPSESENLSIVPQVTTQEICHLIISIGQEVSVSVEGEQTKKRVEVNLNAAQKAILAYLATQGERNSVNSKTLVMAIYGEASTKKHSLFYQHTSRIRKEINSLVGKEFNAVAPLDPFGPKKQGSSRWQLSSSCRLTNLPRLLKWYNSIQKDMPLSSEKWREAAHLLKMLYAGSPLKRSMDERDYSGGYFIRHLDLDAELFKKWAEPLFKQYRKQYIRVLEYFAECEYKLSQNKPIEHGIEKAAELYKECAYAASCLPIDQKLGEKALRKCLEMYMEDNKEDEAEHVCNVYATRIKNVQIEWEPEKATTEMMKEYGIIID